MGNGWLRLTTVAGSLGVSTSAVLEMIEAGELRASREFGSKPAAWLVDGVSYEQFVQRRQLEIVKRHAQDRQLRRAQIDVSGDVDFQRMLAYLDEHEQVEYAAREVVRRADYTLRLFARTEEILLKDDPELAMQLGITA